MKYTDMQALMASQSHKPPPPPLPKLGEIAIGRGTLFKSTAIRPRAGAEYIGSFTTPCGRAWFIEATLAEHTDVHGQARNHFALSVFEAKGPDAAREVLRGATITGDRSAIPQGVLDLVEPLPFNDSLPALEERA